MKKSFLISILFSLVTTAVFSQSALIKSADEEFNKKNYTKAIRLYQKAIKGESENPSSLQVIKKIGDSFNAVNQYEAAISYYNKYFENEKNPEIDFLITYYKIILKINKLQAASDGFKDLQKKHPENQEIAKMVKSCEFALQELSKPNLPDIFLQKQINSSESEFGLAFFNNQLIFASNRFNDNYSSIDGRTNEGYSDLYFAEFDSTLNTYNNPKTLGDEINTSANEGTFAFHSATNTAYFTQCEKNPETCRILSSLRVNERWDSPKAVLLGEPNSNYAHPAFSSDGKILIFASDLPGGFGGKDLWQISVSENGTLGTPENLGSVINTSSDEMFPSMIGDSILLFATEGHIGMGGLDIFYSKINDHVFEPVENVGAPINSTSDDFSILLNRSLKGGYFCSNRNYDENSDDIYAFNHNIFLNDISGVVVDSILTTPLEDVKIVYKTNDKTEKIVTTDSEGKFTIPNSAHVACRNKHSLTLTKEEYPTKIVEVPCSAEKETLIKLFKNTGIHTIKGKVSDILTGEPLEDAQITLNSTKQHTDTVFTDINGNYTIKNIPSNDYIYLRANKAGYLKDLRNFETPDITETVIMNVKTGYPTNFELYPIKKEIEFDIENIYYEFDKARLLPESKVSLNKLVALLNENPRIKIKINSHTDSRGSYEYNEKLSHRRGQSVVNYLLNQGIYKTRLNSEGFGESKPAIPNASTEEEHQQNRRTTFEIIGELEVIPATSQEKAIVKIATEKSSDSILEPKITADKYPKYRIQLLVSSQRIDKIETFKSIRSIINKHTLFEEKQGGLNKYQLGNFQNRNEAEKIKIQFQQLGFSDCFIVTITK